MTNPSALNQLYYRQKKTSGKMDFIAENKQRMYINLHTPIGKDTKNLVIESIYSSFGIQKENIRIYDEYVEILGFDKRFQKDELNDIKQVIDALSEID